MGDAPRVLLVTGAGGAMLRYRVRHLEEALRADGTRTLTLGYRDRRMVDAAPGCDVLVLQRVPLGAQLADWLPRLRARRPDLPVLFDVDDLVVDPGLAAGAPVLRGMDADARELWLEGVRRYAGTLALCDAATVSTADLAARVAARGVPAFVVPNGPGPVALAAADAARALPRPPGPARIGYFSGSPTHDDDLAMVAPALARVLRERPGARLLLVGPVDPGPELAGVAAQVDRHRLVGWRRLPGLLRAVDVVLAPLVPGPFSDAKSPLKWLEAALVEVPTVASPRAGQVEAIADGVDGVLAEGDDAWAVALLGLLDDPGRAAAMGAAARRSVLARLGPQARLAAWRAAVAGAEPGRAAGAPLPHGTPLPDVPWLPLLPEPYPLPGAPTGWRAAGAGAERGLRVLGAQAVQARIAWRREGWTGLVGGAGRTARRAAARLGQVAR